MKACDLPAYYNAVDILERNLPLRQDKIALYSQTRTMTFGDVSAEVNQVGHALTRIGIGFGDLVGLLAPDRPEWVTSFFGTLKIGAIAITLNTSLQPHESGHILRDSRVHVLIVDESLLSIIEPIRDHHPTLQTVIVLGTPHRSTDLEFRRLIENESTELDALLTHREDFCSLHYTSGTTGEPKGVFHAHKDYPLVAQLSGVDLFGLTEADRTFSVAKLFFVYGLGANLLFPWYVGASMVLYAGSTRMINGVLDTIDRFQPTVLVSVPTAYVAKMTVSKFAERYNLSTIRICLSAGEALPPSVWQEWKEKTGLEILDTIGCTESLHTFLANQPGNVRPGSSGRMFPGYTVKIVDEEDRAVPPGTVGNLLVKGESIALAYLHHYAKSKETFRGDWLFTGDKYYVDDEGFHWHVGRSDDMFKVGSLWVSPVEVEGVLTAHHTVRECAVVGHADKTGLSKPKAFVCLHADAQLPALALTKALLTHCGQHLAMYKCPRWIEYVGELPKTATGKIQRFKLRAASH